MDDDDERALAPPLAATPADRPVLTTDLRSMEEEEEEEEEEGQEEKVLVQEDDGAHDGLNHAGLNHVDEKLRRHDAAEGGDGGDGADGDDDSMEAVMHEHQRDGDDVEEDQKAHFRARSASAESAAQAKLAVPEGRTRSASAESADKANARDSPLSDEASTRRAKNTAVSTTAEMLVEKEAEPKRKEKRPSPPVESSSRKKKGKTNKGGSGRSRALIDIPPELTRRSGRQVVKPVRYAQEIDNEENEKRKNEEKERSGSGSPKQRGTKRTKAQAENKKSTKKQKKEELSATAVVEQTIEQADEEVNVDNLSFEMPQSVEYMDVAPKEETVQNNKALPAVSPARRTRYANKNKPKRRKVPMPPWDPVATKKLAQMYPDTYWQESGGIAFINKRHPLKMHTQLQHPGNLYDMAWSHDGEMLATCSSLGTIRLWDTTTWKIIQELRDAEEEKIEEFYTIRFSPDSTKLIAAGKLKHRDRWSIEDDDNQVCPGPIKVFDIISGKILAKFEGHTEEIHCIKTVIFKGKNYLLSASQDGYIMKWCLDDSWTVLESTKRIDEETTNMALGLSFVPHCGNKYFMSAADGGVKIYDFEKEVLLQQFEEIYTGYCDCIKFIDAKEFHKKEGEHYLITRGVEMLSKDDPTQLLRDNSCHLWKLTMPKTPLKSAENAFRLERVRTFSHPSYFSNSWPTHITSNGRYLAAPTSQGEVFIWNLRTGDLVATLSDHEDRECRDILFHPTKPLMLTCCDDATVKVYLQDDQDEKEVIETVDLEGDIDVEGELAEGEGELLVALTNDDAENEDGESSHNNNKQPVSNGLSRGSSKTKAAKKRKMRIEEELEAEFGDEQWLEEDAQDLGEEIDDDGLETIDKEWLKIEEEWLKIEDIYTKIEEEWADIRQERERLRLERENQKA